MVFIFLLVFVLRGYSLCVNNMQTCNVIGGRKQYTLYFDIGEKGNFTELVYNLGNAVLRVRQKKFNEILQSIFAKILKINWSFCVVFTSLKLSLNHDIIVWVFACNREGC